ncbi:MAG TPA: imidazole glycerol phosphate synthase subunit HisH [Firmicutes bacterium]|nr:imidazole glycerol phosphate synthase subunit HisH [Bacillota bacterium]
MVGIIDYGAGNLYSVRKALHYLGMTSTLISRSEDFEKVRALILPGVGAFGEAAHRLEIAGLKKPLQKWLSEGRPFLGICLGMQLLGDSSEETITGQGLSLVRGQCRKVCGKRRIHMGWNRVDYGDDPLFQNIPAQKTFFYFVHGYALPADTEGVMAVSKYGDSFAAAMRIGKVCGVQFHPEKSGKNGLTFLENWKRLWDV